MFSRTVLFAVALALSPATVHAQMSISTIGATDAASCYENANNDLSRDAGPCDEALGDANLTRGDRKKTLVNRGIIHNRAGDLQAAVDDFNAALDIDDSLAEAFLNRGNSYFLAGQHQTALEDYRTALDLGVNKPWAAWYNIGLAYEGLKQKDDAREAYRQSLAMNPTFTQAQLKLAALDQ